MSGVSSRPCIRGEHGSGIGEEANIPACSPSIDTSARPRHVSLDMRLMAHRHTNREVQYRTRSSRILCNCYLVL
jgi:hypothetical protein